MKPAPPVDRSKPEMALLAMVRARAPEQPAQRPGPTPARAPGAEDERALLDRARRGDAAAFGVLAARHQDRAYAVALRITRSPAEAAEVAQEALVRAWRALPGFRGDAGFGTWLHQVVARRALDRAEALQVRRRREVAPEAALEEAAEDGGGADPLAVRRVERLLERLTPAQRAAVTLYYLEDQPVDAVAAALGMPAGTVKTHLHRARAALRQAWEDEGGEP